MISFSYHNNTKSPNIHEIKTGDSSTFENYMENELSGIYNHEQRASLHKTACNLHVLLYQTIQALERFWTAQNSHNFIPNHGLMDFKR